MNHLKVPQDSLTQIGAAGRFPYQIGIPSQGLSNLAFQRDQRKKTLGAREAHHLIHIAAICGFSSCHRTKDADHGDVFVAADLDQLAGVK